MSFFKQIKGIMKEPHPDTDIDTETEGSKELYGRQGRHLALQEAIEIVQKQILGSEAEDSQNTRNLIINAMAGDFKEIDTLKALIQNILDKNKITVNKMDNRQAACQVYASLYGLGVVQPFYEDKTVDEIRVNDTDHIFIVRQGVSERAEVRFERPEDIELVIKRMILDNTGVSLNRSTPMIECVRKDGSRLTAICSPITSSWTFILRKHDSFEPSLENYIENNTLDSKAWQMISILARGRSKILFSGNPGSGKTTLLKKTLGELSDKLRINNIGKDLEMKLKDSYENKDILEMEEQEHLGIKIKDLFYLSLRASPDILVIEEFRGAGEAIEAIRACTRGLPHAMATAHFNSAEEAVEGTALFMLEEGLNLPLELAKLRVARAFNIIVQLFGDAETGQKKLVQITEVVVNEQNQVVFNDLLRWEPLTDDYMGEGNWVLINNPSSNRIKEILKTVKKEDLINLGWEIEKDG